MKVRMFMDFGFWIRISIHGHAGRRGGVHKSWPLADHSLGIMEQDLAGGFNGNGDLNLKKKDLI